MIWLVLALLGPAEAEDICSSSKTNDLIMCAQRDFESADAALNRQWKSALQDAKANDSSYSSQEARNLNKGMEYSDVLIRAQRSWIAFRNAECAARTYGNIGGRELGIYQYSCLAELTKQRTEELRKLTEGN